MASLALAAAGAAVVFAARAAAAEAPHGPAQAALVKLEVRPWGEGRVTIEPAGNDEAGAPAGSVCDRSDLNDFAPDYCVRYFPPGTAVTVTPVPRAGGAFLGWSDYACPGTGPCRLELRRPTTALLGRFTPLKLGVRMGGSGARVTTEPPGLTCEDGNDCLGSFPVGRTVDVVADRSLPAAAWPFGCTPSADGRRCTVTLAEDPHWVGVGTGASRPGRAEALFSVERSGSGTVRGRDLDCGRVCERRYRFGVGEELVARADPGWRFTRWVGECEREQPCRVVVGPVTSVQAVFVRNLDPRLLAVTATGSRASRRFVVRLSVNAPATARVRVYRVGVSRALVDRRYPLRAGRSSVAVPVPRTAPAGRYRVEIGVSDGKGGGRTFRRHLSLGR